jgi:cysteinyl-tRNA synthetase
VRSGVAFDVLVRWLQAQDYAVTLVRNVTDIDDKILHKAIHEERPWWAVAADYERSFGHAYDMLGCQRPTVEPRATGHITQMIELMQRLIDRGHAYAAGGDVYFSVASFADYGALSGQRPADMQPATDSDFQDRKRDSRDFALWKSVKAGEPSWPTPWGAGRPGWHLECSAMAEYYLGERFDIHGGGLDLVFPHHENEIAQSRGAGGDFASFWLHNAWVTTAGEKMSKSLGNSLLVTEVCKRVRPIELRFYLASAHYRSALEFSFQALEESAVAFRRIEGFLNKAGSASAERPAFPDDFTNAMNDDVGVPAALAVIFAMVSQGQQRLADRDYDGAAGVADVVRVMLDVLGCNPQASNWASNEGSAKNAHALSALVDLQLQQRTAARAARDWAAADAIRDALTHAGIDIEDTPDGAHWSVRIDGGE